MATATPAHGIVEVSPELIADSPYFSPDLAPVTLADRRWGTKDMAVLWISMSACIPTYTLASSMIEQGMNWWQAVLTILLGNLIVLVPMILNAHAGTKYGISFPVYCRSSFGIIGANVPAVLRALVACGWFGIQAWIGGAALFAILAVIVPSVTLTPAIPGLGISSWNWRAMAALVLGVLPCIPGFLGTVEPSLEIPPLWMQLYHYAWFLSFSISGMIYFILMKSNWKRGI